MKNKCIVCGNSTDKNIDVCIRCSQDLPTYKEKPG